MTDSTLLNTANASQNPPTQYTAEDIEVLEGLEPVRRRPGMYIGGTDSAALHHLLVEVLDNSMDEAVAGYADKIWVTLEKNNTLSVRDNGRGIPVDPHPRFPDKSALEVILTVLHAGGKFSNKAYSTSGGLHGVGVSVVNALSSLLEVEVAREGKLYKQSYSRGKPLGPIENVGEIRNRRGTLVRFRPDDEIFNEFSHFSAKRVRDIARSKAYLYKGVTIYWKNESSEQIEEETFHYPNGLADFLKDLVQSQPCQTDSPFTGEAKFMEDGKEIGRMEWAIAWPLNEEGESRSYANTIPTPQGGTHETGLRAAILRGIRQYAAMRNKKADQLTTEDILGGAKVLLSIFIQEPQFQSQTKDRLANREATRLVENGLKDRFDLWLAADPTSADNLLGNALERAEERNRRRKEQEVKRKTAVSRKLRLPGKLADCSESAALGTEIFLVEGDSAGGNAKQARDRKTQAILPLRGKILNVANATKDKITQNSEVQDIIMALGCGTGKDCNAEKLRYERVIIMTDADVDGAHIATLLMTFFYQEMPNILLNGCVYLGMPPLYKMSHSGHTIFAQDDADKDRHLATTFKGKKNIDITRFKGLGEMPAAQLKETTMSHERRKLMQVNIESLAEANNLVRRLMGKNPEERLMFIREFGDQAAVDV